MIKFLKKSSAWALSIITVIFTFLPEKIFEIIKLLSKCTDEVNVMLNRILLFCGVLILSIIANALYIYLRESIYVKGKNYMVKVEYGDIFKMKNCKRVISFDECFSTKVGKLPSDINPDSICGQYLQNNSIQDMQGLIDSVGLKPIKGKSQYKNKDRYESGRVVPNDSELLMAFAKLDKDGLGVFLGYEEFLDCLSILWKEIDKYYGQKDVCIPILGSGVTRMGQPLTQQELLDIIIASYKLSVHKIKSPNKLHIVCKRREDFSLNKVGENI